eukprot:2225034-Rhodomonas_salina.1
MAKLAESEVALVTLRAVSRWRSSVTRRGAKPTTTPNPSRCRARSSPLAATASLSTSVADALCDAGA